MYAEWSGEFNAHSATTPSLRTLKTALADWAGAGCAGGDSRRPNSPSKENAKKRNRRTVVVLLVQTVCLSFI